MKNQEERSRTPVREENNERAEHIIAGRNAVFEAVKSGRTIDTLYVARGNRSGSIVPILAKAIRLDPAVMASPFITTVVDVMSLLVYFWVAGLLLPV